MSILDFLRDLGHPDLAFLQRALVVTAMAAAVCGVVGCHVVLRGMSFVGDAVSHAVFPGLAVAFVTQGSLVVGGMVAGVVTALAMSIVSQNRRLKEDSVIGIFLVGSFALGLVVISRSPGYAGSLQHFLFGSITGIPARDVWITAAMGLVVLTALAVLHSRIVAVSLDREMARALGLRVAVLDAALAVCIAVAVVTALQTVGNILVLALLVAPPATARLLTDRLRTMLLVSPAIGAAGATVGVYLSWSYDLPAGATIVLVLTTVFALAWSFAPRHGLAPRAAALLRMRSGGATGRRPTR